MALWQCDDIHFGPAVVAPFTFLHLVLAFVAKLLPFKTNTTRVVACEQIQSPPPKPTLPQACSGCLLALFESYGEHFFTFLVILLQLWYHHRDNHLLADDHCLVGSILMRKLGDENLNATSMRLRSFSLCSILHKSFIHRTHSS